MQLKKLWRTIRWIAIAVIACLVMAEIPHWVLGLIAIFILWPAPRWIEKRLEESGKGGQRNAA